MNKTVHTGRLTADVELKKTPSGVSVCSFSLAVRRPRTKDKTDFLDFVAWRGNAEFVCNHFKKGDAMEVSGMLTTRKYKDSNGYNRTVYEIECDEVSFCLTNGKAEQTEPTKFVEVGESEGLPF